jgi:hypothetical protein
MGSPLHTPLQVRGGFWGFWGRPEPIWCCNVTVEATTGFKLYPTSILDTYKAFWYLDRLCMGIWAHPYSDVPLQVGGGFWGFGGRPEPVWCYNVIVEATTTWAMEGSSSTHLLQLHITSVASFSISFLHPILITIWLLFTCRYQYSLNVM